MSQCGGAACRLQNVLVTEVMPDVFVNAVLYALRERPDITDVILGRDGQWRVSESEPWQDIRRAPPDALCMGPPPSSEPPPVVAPTAVVDVAPPQKPSPLAARQAGSQQGGAAIEILSSSDDDAPIAARGGGAASGSAADARAGVVAPGTSGRAWAGMSAPAVVPAIQPPPLKRPRVQQAQNGAMASSFGGMPLAPQLGGHAVAPTSQQQQQHQPPVFVAGAQGGPPAAAQGHVEGGLGQQLSAPPQQNLHNQSMPNHTRRDGFAFR